MIESNATLEQRNQAYFKSVFPFTMLKFCYVSALVAVSPSENLQCPSIAGLAGLSYCSSTSLNGHGSYAKQPRLPAAHLIQ